MANEIPAVAEQQLRAGRMDAFAALAGGLAHELNNLLAGMVMVVDLLAGSCTRQRDRDVLIAMEESARRGVDLVRQVLWLARGVEEETALFQPKYLLLDAQRMARALFPAAVSIASEFPPDLWLLRGDPFAVYRILLDLCLEARCRLAAGGELVLAARNSEVDEIAASQHPGAAPGPYLVLEVATSAGGGSYPEAVSAGVQAGGGFSEVAARTGGGQAFRAYLPAVRRQAEAAESPVAETAAGELVLIVEGDTGVRLAMAGVLEKYGYSTLAAADGAEAVALFARSSPAAAVLASDLRYLDGPGVLRALRRLSDGIPAVVTGSAAQLAAWPEDAGAGRIALAKPFTVAGLLAALRQALAPSPPR